MAAGRFSSIRTRVERASSQLFAVMDAHTRDWSVSRKLGGMIGLFAGFLVVSSLILIFCIVRTGHALQEVRTITAVSSSLSDANAAAAHAQSRAKDYVITPNAELGNAVVEEMEAAQGIVRNVDAQLGAVRPNCRDGGVGEREALAPAAGAQPELQNAAGGRRLLGEMQRGL